MTGTMPLPSFPVLSAMSCSSQPASGPTSGETKSVNLSRPAVAATPRNAPNQAAGYFLKINPFDQPNVEATKKKTREILERTASKDVTGPAKPVLIADGLRIYAERKPGSPREAMDRFLENSREGDYIAVQVFLAVTAELQGLLEEFSRRLYDKRRLPVTIGYGPRYLHSTGQLHKGDGNRGLFIQLARPASADVPIPEIPEIHRPAPSFGVLFSAQGWGDWLALRDLGRRTLRLEFEGSAEQGLRRLIALFE